MLYSIIPRHASVRSFQIYCEAAEAAAAEADQCAYDYDVAVDKFDFASVQSPDMRSSRCKKILDQSDEPQKLSVKFSFLGERGNFGGQK